MEAALSGNETQIIDGDLRRLRIQDYSVGEQSLLAGQLGAGDRDRLVLRGVTGTLAATVLGFASSETSGHSPAEGRFVLRVNGERVQSFDLTANTFNPTSFRFQPVRLNGYDVVIVARSIDGQGQYDLALVLNEVPLPATALLLLSGILAFKFKFSRWRISSRFHVHRLM